MQRSASRERTVIFLRTPWVKQIHHRLKRLEGGFTVTKEAGRIYAEASEAFDFDEVVNALQHVFGIVGICPMLQIEDNGYEDLKAQVVPVHRRGL